MSHPVVRRFEVVNAKEEPDTPSSLISDACLLIVPVGPGQQDGRLRTRRPDHDPSLRATVVRVRRGVLDELEPECVHEEVDRQVVVVDDDGDRLDEHRPDTTAGEVRKIEVGRVPGGPAIGPQAPRAPRDEHDPPTTSRAECKTTTVSFAQAVPVATSSPEVPLLGGRLTAGVVRVGDTVRRPGSEASATVRDLLQHLEAVGFDGAPRSLGVDEQGRDVLEFLPGHVPAKIRPLADEQVRAGARLLRRFHDATRGAQLVGDHEVVCHGDAGPNNAVFRDGLPVAFTEAHRPLFESALGIRPRGPRLVA